MIDDILVNKRESIERCVRQIRDYYSRPSEKAFEHDFFKQDAISSNLQRAAGIIDTQLSKSLQGMVGFRNVLVHDYQELEISIMKDVIESKLDDLLHFMDQVFAL